MVENFIRYWINWIEFRVIEIKLDFNGNMYNMIKLMNNVIFVYEYIMIMCN